jgi:regulator of replication initiation timing
MYTDEQVNGMIKTILENLTDQGVVSNALNDFKNDYTNTLTDYEKLTNDKTTLEKNNESLKAVNNKIMLQLGDVSTIVKKENEKTEEKKNENKEEYENLFNENGELN